MFFVLFFCFYKRDVMKNGFVQNGCCTKGCGKRCFCTKGALYKGGVDNIYIYIHIIILFSLCLF